MSLLINFKKSYHVVGKVNTYTFDKNKIIVLRIYKLNLNTSIKKIICKNSIKMKNYITKYLKIVNTSGSTH